MLMSKKITYDNSKKITFITLLNILSFFTLYKLSIYIANYTSFCEWRIVRDIVGINIIVGFISIFSFFLYSYLYNDDYFHMFSLVYISIYCELVFIAFLGEMFNVFELMEINTVFIGLAPLFRTIIIWLAFYEQNPINRYLNKNKLFSILLSIFITTICLLLDIYIIKHELLNSHILIIKALKIITNTLTYVILIKFSILYVYRKSTNYFIIFIGTDIMFLGRILLTLDLYLNKHIMYLLNRVVLATGFITIIISMFLEIIAKTKENRMLINKFNTQLMEINRLK